MFLLFGYTSDPYNIPEVQGQDAAHFPGRPVLRLLKFKDRTPQNHHDDHYDFYDDDHRDHHDQRDDDHRDANRADHHDDKNKVSILNLTDLMKLLIIAMVLGKFNSICISPMNSHIYYPTLILLNLLKHSL